MEESCTTCKNNLLSSISQLMHAINRKKTMFENVNIDWHLSHEEGSTDFSDDETLDDHRLLNGSHFHSPTGRSNIE